MEVLARAGRWRALAAIALLATIALVAAGASPAEAIPIKRGHTKLILSQSIFNDLDPLGIGILPIAPAGAVSGGEQFPITGGRVSRDASAARINHDGGIKFAGDNAKVRVTRVKVHLNTEDSKLIASVDDQRMSFLSLEGGHHTSSGRSLTIRRIHATLTRKAGNAFNQAFATNVFKKGMRLGKLRIDMTLVR
ncbi:MAG: hypothetical protein ACRDLL_02615 [Solirubrobacterales bacterium]